MWTLIIIGVTLCLVGGVVFLVGLDGDRTVLVIVGAVVVIAGVVFGTWGALIGVSEDGRRAEAVWKTNQIELIKRAHPELTDEHIQKITDQQWRTIKAGGANEANTMIVPIIIVH